MGREDLLNKIPKSHTINTQIDGFDKIKLNTHWLGVKCTDIICHLPGNESKKDKINGWLEIEREG